MSANRIDNRRPLWAPKQSCRFLSNTLAKPSSVIESDGTADHSAKNAASDAQAKVITVIITANITQYSSPCRGPYSGGIGLFGSGSVIMSFQTPATRSLNPLRVRTAAV